MTDAPPAPAADPAAHTPSHRSPAAPLFLWVVIQLAALALAALRVPLSARFPLAGEQLAIHVMIVVQVSAAALLFPFLLRDSATTLMVVFTSLPFVQLAAYLSSTPLPRAALAAVYLACWLVTLAMWRWMLRTRGRSKLIGVAAATAWSIGGAIAWYAAAESREAAPIDWSRDGAFGPILGGVAQLTAQHPVAPPWVIALVVLALSALVALSSARRESRGVGGSGNPPSRV